MNEGLKVKRFDLLNEDDFVIIKDKQMLLHNIKNEELKEKDEEIERLHSIIKEVREYIDSKEYVGYGIIEVDEMKIRKILDEGE